MKVDIKQIIEYKLNRPKRRIMDEVREDMMVVGVTRRMQKI